MADLTHLNEAAVLHNLRQRYYSRIIYVSVNMDQLLIRIFLSLSHTHRLDSTLPPVTKNISRPIFSRVSKNNRAVDLTKQKIPKSYPSQSHTNFRLLNDPTNSPRTSRKTSSDRSTPPSTKNAKTCRTWLTLTMPRFSITWDSVIWLSSST